MQNTYDLLVITDATSSMGSYLDALRTSIPEVLALAKLSGAFSRLGVLAYRDYSEPEDERICWSGWNPNDLLGFARTLEPSGGGDYAEAAKTALIRGLQAVDKNAQTLVLWYSDAPPHHYSFRSYQNDVKEAESFPAGATDWVKLCRMAMQRNCTVFSFTPKLLDHNYSCFYTLLSEFTGGISISTKVDSSALISRLTLDIILQWMGHASAMEISLQGSSASLNRYEVSPLLATPKPSNELAGSRGYLPSPADKGTPLLTIHTSPLKSSDIPIGLSSSSTSNLAKRFSNPAEQAYREQVYESLSTIIESNVASLTYNPIFGQLWRAVCKDTNISEKTRLLNAFSDRVGKITDPAQKADLAQWLEESFDATEEIEGIMARVPAGGPAVYLDLDSDVELTRTELLEVSRSCYSGVLKKVASIFTHLKLVEPGVTLAPQQRAIPLSLAPRDFFRILPHLVVPGTLYPVRAASLTAILSLTTAVPFLRDSATALLAPLKGTWLDLEVPENISFDCAKLLLSAPEGLVLNAQERVVYAAMRRYRYIEMNWESMITVRVPWTPRKTTGVGDWRVKCKRCLIRRSVTMISAVQRDVCGLCVVVPGVVKKPRNFTNEVEAESCWVECSTKTCHAQYVIEDIPALRIRPRCYYCRNNTPCPFLQCTRCANRIIIPKLYRTSSDTPAQFICPACACSPNGVKTIVEQETTTRALVAESGVGWLGLPRLEGVMEGKSAFKLMQAHGPQAFGASPSSSKSSHVETELALVLDGKKVHNAGEVLEQIEGRVGRGEVELGSCALCYEDGRREGLVLPCGRSGCAQRVDGGCLSEWYGKSTPGHLLYPTQLACPFCRRLPALKVLARYNPRATTLCGLQLAMDDRQYFYAWCIECGFAKRAYERACCGEERVGELEGWRCAECVERHERAVARAHAELNGRLYRVEDDGVGKKVVDTVDSFMHCPNCDVCVEKTDGCNHITCICGQHFCYVCGQGTAAEKIYNHISKQHGGAYGY